MRIIIPYSDIKIIANNHEPYSMLNPETNSDSPSAKSKGVRLVSARTTTSQIILIIGKQINILKFSWVFKNKLTEKLSINKENPIKIIAILTSYEIICAKPRYAPINEYFEFEAQPPNRIE